MIEAELISSDFNEKAFWKMLLDNQLQIDLEKEFYQVRNMLVAQALEPYQNIDDLLKRLV